MNSTREELYTTLARVSVSEKRWLKVRHILSVVALLLVVVLEVALVRMFLPGMDKVKSTPSLGVVRITGPMSAESDAGADKVLPALEAAFSDGNVKEVALLVDSPGGAPAEAERIGAYLQAQRKKTGKPTVAIISNLGASAAYLTAIHADTVLAGRYSLVGSIGAVVQAWGVDRLLQKLDVEQRVFASGRFKTMLNPFQPLSEETAVRVQGMADTAGATFARDVMEKRGERLKLADYATGEVWQGEVALAYGLIDGIGTLEGHAAEKGLEIKYFGPYSHKALPLLRGIAESVADALAARLLSVELH